MALCRVSKVVPDLCLDSILEMGALRIFCPFEFDPPSILHASDCNFGIEFAISGSGIEKFVIPGSRFGIRLTDWSSF